MTGAVRKQYIIKRNLQFGLFVETAIFLLVVAIIVGLSIYLGIFRTLLFELSGEKITLINRFISLRLLVWFIPTVIAIVIASVFLSHRIAGPVFVFQRTIDDIMSGKTPHKIRLRKHDKLKDLAEDINRLIDHLATDKS